MRFLDCLVAEVVRRADDRAALDATPGHPHREPKGIVISPIEALTDRHPSELAMPQDERFIEQAAALEVFDQSGDRQIRFAGVLSVKLLERPVLVPSRLMVAATRIELDDAHTALDQPSRHQDLTPKVLCSRCVKPVELACGGGLLRDIHRLGRMHLHSIGQLVGLDARGTALCRRGCGRDARD